MAKDHETHYLRPLVEAWRAKIELAKKARKEFDDVADQCTDFFAGATGFMFKPGYMQKYFGGSLSSRFKITICKAFEFVAVYLPKLYWRNPNRRINPIEEIQYTWEDFLPDGWQPPPPPQLPPPPPDDAPDEVKQQYAQLQEQAQQPPPEVQQAQQILQQTTWQRQQRSRADNVRAQLFEKWLNYTPNEMPGGGMAQHCELAIIDAAVTGRGIVQPKHYKMPGSQRTLTGNFYVPQSNVWFDPDATSRDNAWWMCIREDLPYWEWERKFGLEKDSLKEYCNHESGNSKGERSSNPLNKVHRAQGRTNDILTVYHVYSKMGMGARLSGVKVNLTEELDPVAGDYCYLAVCSAPYPLNCPTEALDEDDEQIAKRFEWDTPYWMDDKWPVSFLEFYQRPGSPYPIAPLMPGLGELSYINLFVSHLAGRIWSSSRDFIVLLEHMAKFLEKDLRGGDDMCIIKVPSMVKDVQSAVAFLQQPQVNLDAWRIIDRLFEQFERRVGLTPSIYGQNEDTQARSATDAKQKLASASVRQQFMAAKTAKWQSEVADMEKCCCRFHIEAADVRERLGDVGAYFWTKYITDTDPEIVMRETRCTVEAASMRMPDKDKEVDDAQMLIQQALPVALEHSQATGNSEPINAIFDIWLDANEMNKDPRLNFGPHVPQPPPPEAQQQQEQMMQLEMAKIQAELQKSQADIQVKAMDVQLKQAQIQSMGVEMQTEQQKTAMDLQADQIRTQQKLQLAREKHQAQLQMKQEKTAMEMQFKAAKSQTDAALQQQSAQQKLLMDALSHQSKQVQQARMAEGQIEIQHAKAKQAMRQATMKPKPNGSKSNAG